MPEQATVPCRWKDPPTDGSWSKAGGEGGIGQERRIEREEAQTGLSLNWNGIDLLY